MEFGWGGSRRQLGCRNPYYGSKMASASISTSISGEINLLTSTMEVAGRMS
jgi:hypothetical protein